MHPSQQRPSTVDKQNFLSRIFFIWMTNIINLGCRKNGFNLYDLQRAAYKDTSKVLHEILDQAWEKHLEICRQKNKEPSLPKVLVQVFGPRYFKLGLNTFIEECVAKVIQSLALGYLLEYFNGTYKNYGIAEVYYGYGSCVGIILPAAYYMLSHHLSSFEQRRVAIRIRVACTAMVYRKALRLNLSAMPDSLVGKVINIIATDLHRFDRMELKLNYIWVAPIQLAIVIFITWKYLGPVSLIGLVLLFVYIPLQSFLAYATAILRKHSQMHADSRVKAVNEIFNILRTIKLHGWEDFFLKRVDRIRRDEFANNQKQGLVQAINATLAFVSTKTVVFLLLFIYVLQGNKLDPESAFVCLTLYNHLRVVMTVDFANSLNDGAELYISALRVQKFLLKEERPALNDSLNIEDDEAKEGASKDDITVQLDHVTSAIGDKVVLRDISLTLRKGRLVAVVGEVGAGKTSLLLTILGEIPVVEGILSRKGTLAYDSQMGFLIATATIRDNITLGRPFDEKFYSEVVDACCLTDDFAMFTNGDETSIADLNLSGGQIERITLARAIYSDADVYMLDDPVASVDILSTFDIIERVFFGILRSKSVIVITHQTLLLDKADEVIFLHEGKIKAKGKVEDLQQAGIRFSIASEADLGKIGSLHEEMQMRRYSSFKIETGDEILIQEPSADDLSRPASNISRIQSGAESLESGSINNIDEGSTQVINLTEQYRLHPPSHLIYRYLRSGCSSYWGIVWILLISILTQLIFTGTDWWLEFWTFNQANNVTACNRSTILNELKTCTSDQHWIYGVLIGSLFIVSLIRSYLFFAICNRAGYNLFKEMLNRIIRAPIQYYDRFLTRKVLNRASKNTGTLDDLLPMILFETLEVYLDVAGIFILVCVTNYYLIIPSLIVGALFYILRKYYKKTAITIKYLEGQARIPVTAILNSTLSGICTIRAFKQEPAFLTIFDELHDVLTLATFACMACYRWFSLVIGWCCFCYATAVTIIVFSLSGPQIYEAHTMNKNNMTSEGSKVHEKELAKVGLVIALVISLTSVLQCAIKQMAETDSLLISFVKVLEFEAVKPEADRAYDKSAPEDWPSLGEVKFVDVDLKANDFFILCGVTHTFQAGCKTALVGRSGSGKSSLLSALLRIIEPSNDTIEIDGVNICDIPLKDVRQRISIIPQNPIMFAGTIRENLDPYEQYTDDEIWNALRQVHLYDVIESKLTGLETEVIEGGANCTFGQRQLFAISRAILGSNKIIVCDEPTANMDREMQSLIMSVISANFNGRTVLSAAHRLETIIGDDEVVVMNNGEIVEYGEPYVLIKNRKSVFYELVQTTGKLNADTLVFLAKQATEKRKQSMMPWSVPNVK